MVKLNTGFKLAALLQVVQTEMRMNDKASVIRLCQGFGVATEWPGIGTSRDSMRSKRSQKLLNDPL
jgi:hypothetical protein